MRNEVTSYEHICRLYCSTVILNGDEKSNSSNCELNGSLSVANFELLEYLLELNNTKEDVIEVEYERKRREKRCKQILKFHSAVVDSLQ